MKKNKLILSCVVIFIGILLLHDCKTYYFRSNYQDANALLYETKYLETKPFLKAHLKNGNVCVLRDVWQVDTLRNIVSGEGAVYDFNRVKASYGPVKIPIDSIAIFETNKKIINPEGGRITALSILTAVDVIVGIICITNPKACFGSCPTFYIDGNANFHSSDAEGFSSAILPSLEYADIDALKNEAPQDQLFSITMKNEALETHCVKEVKLLAFPRKMGEHVYQSPDDEFYLCENQYLPGKATGDEGNITPLLQKADMNERFSLADPDNLNSKEEIFLDFYPVAEAESIGLVVDFRQTLMISYLFYSAMGLMGNNVGDVFSRLERDSVIREKFDGTTEVLGKIEVFQWNGPKEEWQLQGQLFETGPIAINRQIIPLANHSSDSGIKLKLVLNKGLWRIDFAGLASIKTKVQAIEIEPNYVLNKGNYDEEALSLVRNPDKYLISMPGSEYQFNFALPLQNVDYELFLSSKGYYLEWMRKHWIKDKDLVKLRQMVENPEEFLKREAKEYKQYETTMEQEFWNSKIDTKIFSYYEN